MKSAFSFCILLFTASAIAQPVKLELGMKRNTAQTMMDKAKIDSYKKNQTVFVYPDSVLFTISFDENEICTGFFFSGKDEPSLEKCMESNGFTKRDNLSFIAKDFPGVMKKESENTTLHFRFLQSSDQNSPQPQTAAEDETAKEKPFYGMTILGTKVWEAKQESH